MGMLPMDEGTFFWAVDGAWGTFTWKDEKSVLEALYGELALKEWVLSDAVAVRNTR